MPAADLDDLLWLQVTDERIVNRRIKTAEEVVVEIEVEGREFVTIASQFIDKS
jgi:hypothetical protein